MQSWFHPLYSQVERALAAANLDREHLPEKSMNKLKYGNPQPSYIVNIL